MREILKYVLRYKSLVIIPTIAMLMAISLDMFNPYLQKSITDRVFLVEKKTYYGLYFGVLL